MECMVVCGKDLAAAKGVREVANMTHIGFCPKGNDVREMSKPLFVLFRSTNRYG